MFLGITAKVDANWSTDDKQFSLVLSEENPLQGTFKFQRVSTYLASSH